MSRDPDYVIAPGGPRPAHTVHGVPPGWTVHRTGAGTYLIVDPSNPQQTGDAAVAEEYVITPGGLRPRAAVHMIAPGLTVREDDHRVATVEPSGGIERDLGVLVARAPHVTSMMPHLVARPPAPAPALGTGWITYASWTNSSGTPVASFTTTCTVPPAPPTQSGQTIFLFNGI